MRRVAGLLAAGAVALAGCGSEPGAAEPRQRLTVLAAASLTETFGELERAFEDAHPGTDVVLSFAGSQVLVAQLRSGAPADVVVTADQQSMAAVAGELAAPARTFATNALAVLVEEGNPHGVRGLADLARPDLVVVLAGETVPAGRAARAALARAGVTLRPASLEPDVKAVVGKVRLGEADAGIAYATDLAAAPELDGVVLPGVAVSYPIGVLRSAADPGLARQFVDLVLSGEGRAVLGRAGFGAP